MAKTRVFITTDIGGSDPDDNQSIVHALLYSDKYQLEGLVSSPTKYAGRTSDLHEVIDVYAKDYANLKTWSAEYPTPDYLHSIVAQGRILPQPSQGYSSATPGSQAIIAAAHEAQQVGQPLWVLAWGAMTDIAQALHDDPSIVSMIRVNSLGGWNTEQDPAARNYVYNNFKNLWWIEDNTTLRGIYVNSTGSESNPWKMSDAAGHGALGDYFVAARPEGLKLGDAPSLIYLLDTADDNNPAADSWGGRFVQNGHGPNYWVDSSDPALKVGEHYAGAKSILIHQQEIYNDFIKHFDRADVPKSGSTTTSTDDPVFANHDAATTAMNVAIKVNVLANDSAPDGGLKVSAVSAASAQGGKAVINTDGTVTYTPKTGFVGTDTVSYTARDTDGDTDTANLTVTVTSGAASGGSGHVYANDDSYTIDAGATLYFNAKYLLTNDTASAGGLKVVGVDSLSTNGVAVSWQSDGTVIYKAAAGFNGTDRIGYKAGDINGATDTGTVTITVGTGTSGSPTTPLPSPSPTSGSVQAYDDQYNVKVNQDFYFNAKYLTLNDKSAAGGLKVVAIDSVGDYGGKLSFAADGTAIYRAASNFTGVDRVNYTVVDKYGAGDAGTIYLNVGGSGTLSLAATAPASLTSTAGNDVLEGNGSANVLLGGAGNDTLHGDAGNDTLNGGTGNDLLFGDAGADRFVLDKGKMGSDTIADFNTAAGDRIATDYQSSQISGWNTASLTLQAAGGPIEQLTGTGHIWTPADFLFS